MAAEGNGNPSKERLRGEHASTEFLRPSSSSSRLAKPRHPLGALVAPVDLQPSQHGLKRRSTTLASKIPAHRPSCGLSKSGHPLFTVVLDFSTLMPLLLLSFL